MLLSRQGPVLVLLLYGTDKGDQRRAIEQAIAYLTDWMNKVLHALGLRLSVQPLAPGKDEAVCVDRVI